MKLKKMAQIVLSIGLVLLLLLGCISAAFYLTSFLYDKIGWNPSAWLTQIVNTFLGLFFAIAFVLLFVSMLSLFSAKKEENVFAPIINALEKIANGDFTIRLDKNKDGKGVLEGLVESVNQMALELGHIETMRQDFVSNMSHEIQSPLTSISGFARALRNESLSVEERLHYLGIIEAESRRLSGLSDNLLRLASLESEAIKLEPKPYRMDKQIRNIILACEPQWTDKRIKLEVSLEEVSAYADENLMNQVWVNLIHNSIKFTPEGGSIEVHMHQQQSGNDIEFRISDTGIGISQEDQAHIFERFYKADKSRSRSNAGSGLGLSIVKKIVDLHHGTIAVKSELGKGCIFFVTLPKSL